MPKRTKQKTRFAVTQPARAYHTLNEALRAAQKLANRLGRKVSVSVAPRRNPGEPGVVIGAVFDSEAAQKKMAGYLRRLDWLVERKSVSGN